MFKTYAVVTQFDKKSVSLDYYSTWKLIDPVLYLKTVKNQTGAEERLIDFFLLAFWSTTRAKKLQLNQL